MWFIPTNAVACAAFVAIHVVLFITCFYDCSHVGRSLYVFPRIVCLTGLAESLLITQLVTFRILRAWNRNWMRCGMFDMPHLGALTALCQAWHCWSCGVCGGSNFRSPDSRGMCSSLGKMAMACESNWNARWSWKNEKLTCHSYNGQDDSELKQDPVTIPFVKECLVALAVCFPASGWAPP